MWGPSDRGLAHTRKYVRLRHLPMDRGTTDGRARLLPHVIAGGTTLAAVWITATFATGSTTIGFVMGVVGAVLAVLAVGLVSRARNGRNEPPPQS